MLSKPTEVDVRTQINRNLENLGWILDSRKAERNVFQETPRTEEEKKKLKGKRPDYVLYPKGRTSPLIIIETKKRGANIQDALKQGVEYAEILKAPIVFATDGVYCKTFHTFKEKPLFLNGEEVDELIRELLALRYLENNEVNTISEKVIYSRQELIRIFDETNNILRVEGLRAGIERFSEFSNLLFLKLISENETIRLEKEGKTKLNPEYLWDKFKSKSEVEIIDFINRILLPHIAEQYKDGNIFQPLAIKNGTVVKRIIDRLDTLTLTDINSDIKGDAFEYFLKASTTHGNDLGEYFTPRHIVKTMVKLVNPQLGEKIYDPFCGTGGLLIESFRHIEKNIIPTEQNKAILREHSIYGNEITNTARITKMNMILVGDGHSNIQMKNSLAEPIDEKFDIVVTNMPYSQNTEYGSLYDIPTNNGDSVCVQHCIRAISKSAPNGRIAIVVPEGLLFRKDLQKTREYILKNTYLQSIISLPQGVFMPYTSVKADILYLTKIKQNVKQKHYWFFEIQNDGYTLNAHRRKKEGESDLDKFLAFRNTENYNNNTLLDIGFNILDLETVAKNNYILSANRYRSLLDYSNVKFELVELKNLIVETSERAKENQYPVWSVSNKFGFVRSKDFFSERVASENTEKYKIVGENYFAYNPARINVGSIAVNLTTENGLVSPMYVVFKVSDESKLNTKFLFHLLKSEILRIELINKCQGSVREILKFDDLALIKIPLPSLDIQKRIVNELDSYYQIIEGAKNVVENYKPIIKYLPSWDSVELSEVCKFSGGTQPPKSTFIYEPKEDYIRLLQIRDYKSDEQAVYIPKMEKHKTCNEADIMIGRYGPPVFQILRGKSGAYNVALIKCIPDNNKLANDWLFYFLNSPSVQEHIISLSERSRQSGVSPEDLNKLKIPLPSLETQMEFIKQIKQEQKLVDTNNEIITIFANKVKQKINEICGINN